VLRGRRPRPRPLEVVASRPYPAPGPLLYLPPALSAPLTSSPLRDLPQALPTHTPTASLRSSLRQYKLLIFASPLALFAGYTHSLDYLVNYSWGEVSSLQLGEAGWVG
jgi:hypothetical protein